MINLSINAYLWDGKSFIRAGTLAGDGDFRYRPLNPAARHEGCVGTRRNDSSTTTVAYIASAALLTVMAVISLLNAGRNTFIAYRLCAPIFSASAILLLAAAVM